MQLSTPNPTTSSSLYPLAGRRRPRQTSRAQQWRRRRRSTARWRCRRRRRRRKRPGLRLHRFLWLPSSLSTFFNLLPQGCRQEVQRPSPPVLFFVGDLHVSPPPSFSLICNIHEFILARSVVLKQGMNFPGMDASRSEGAPSFFLCSVHIKENFVVLIVWIYFL